MSLRDRIGIDVGRRLRLEEALEWAAEHEVRWIDIQLDAGANALSGAVRSTRRDQKEPEAGCAITRPRLHSAIRSPPRL
jgi:hypothetical protein